MTDDDRRDIGLSRESPECGSHASNTKVSRRHDGTLLALFSDKWRLAQVQREHPDILLEQLIAG